MADILKEIVLQQFSSKLLPLSTGQWAYNIHQMLLGRLNLGQVVGGLRSTHVRDKTNINHFSL